MTTSSVIKYHLAELEIAKTPDSPRHIMPTFSSEEQAILDIGCGIGQTFVASEGIHDRLLVGIDIDLEALVYGHKNFDYILFAQATAERLPFPDSLFDLVISRVVLPLTNMPVSLREIARVLKRNGRIWFTLHPFSMVTSHLFHSLQNLNAKDAAYRIYAILNGLVFNSFGNMFPFPMTNKYESFQTNSGMTRAMKKIGFEGVTLERKGKHLVCTARKKP
ncbi:MAG: class I SAM-dependent methyltransferase [Gemmataceae bacterium]